MSTPQFTLTDINVLQEYFAAAITPPRWSTNNGPYPNRIDYLNYLLIQYARNKK